MKKVKSGAKERKERRNRKLEQSIFFIDNAKSLFNNDKKYSNSKILNEFLHGCRSDNYGGINESIRNN